MPLFTKKHYIVLAKVVRESEDKMDLVHKLTALFKKDNKGFDGILFIKDCMDSESKARVERGQAVFPFAQ